MLAAHLTWNLPTALAEFTYTNEERPVGEDPMAKAERSAGAARKTSIRTQAKGEPTYGFQDLLTHLDTRTRNSVAVTGVEQTLELLALPTITQNRAMELIAGHLEQLKSAPT